MVPDLLLPGTRQVLARWPVTTATAEERGAPEPLEQAFLPLPRAALPLPLQSHVSFLRTRGGKGFTISRAFLPVFRGG